MRAQVSVPSLFLGITPSPVRRQLAAILGPAVARYDRIILPCSGRFGGTMVALSAGFRPQQVYCSDISLFSGLIGMLSAGKDPRELGAVVNLPAIPELEGLANLTKDPVDHAAAVLLAMKIATTQVDQGGSATAYAKMFISDLMGDWRRHFEKLKAKLLKLTGDLKGINYEPADLFDAVARAADDPKALIYLAPPDVSGGYVKMFDYGDMVTFQQPPIENFDPKSGFTRLWELTRDARALILTLQPHDDRKAEKHPNAIFALLNGERLSLLLANRKADALSLAKLRTTSPPEKLANPRYPVWGGKKDRIRADSKVFITKTKKEIAMYYRDLFAHRLGASNAEAFFLMWLDGKLFGTLGFHLQAAISGRPYDAADGRLFVWQTFGMSPNHPSIRHVNRLVTMCLTCEDFLKVLKKTTRFPVGDPVGVRTVCFTKGPEHKGNRGIMKLLRREKGDNGLYHLVYATEWRPGTFADQVKLWVQKYDKPTTEDTRDEEGTSASSTPAA